MANIIIPTPLRKFTQNQAKLELNAQNVEDALNQLIQEYPELKKHLLDDVGNIRSYVNFFVGEEDIRDLENENTPLNTGDTLSIIPAIAGGAGSKNNWKDVSFNSEELARYNRHIIVPELGLDAQKKLKAAKVLVIGAGGLGSPVLLYLAAAGVGTIGIVDFDVVDDSNLHRQVLFGIENVGQPKALAAKERLTKLNPHINIQTYNTALNATNALNIFADYDIVADGTDNFATRYLVNDAAVLSGIPNVYASIFRFDGQVSVFNYKDNAGNIGPNYRDLYPTPPPAGLVPNCAKAGVLGVLPGIIGSLQALEVIKIITDSGNLLNGKLYTFDALTFESKTFKIKRRAENPLNGENPTQTALIDYESFCGTKEIETTSVKEINPTELKDWLTTGKKFQLVDVREPHEFDITNLDGVLIPLGEIPLHINEIEREIPVVIHCRSGVRSAKAIEFLEKEFGFNNLYNLNGGILRWIDEIEPSLTKY